MEILIQIIGWVGTILIISAYFLVSSKKIQSSSYSYQMLNFIGAVAVGISVFYQHAWSALALQIAWVIIAGIALIRMSSN